MSQWFQSTHSPTLRRFTYVTAHSPTLPPLHLRHSSFYNPYVASPTSQALHLPRRYFTYVTWRAARCPIAKSSFNEILRLQLFAVGATWCETFFSRIMGGGGVSYTLLLLCYKLERDRVQVAATFLRCLQNQQLEVCAVVFSTSLQSCASLSYNHPSSLS